MIVRFFRYCFINILNLKGLFLLFFVLTSFGNVVCRGSVILAIPLTTNSPKNIPVNVFYKGDCFEALVSKKIGDQLNISEISPGRQFMVVVSEQFETVKQRIGSDGIRGIKVSNGAAAKCYGISLSIVCDKNGKVTYKWDIEEEDIPLKTLPENAVIINFNPSAINILGHDDNFDLPYLREVDNGTETALSGILVLPTIHFDVENLSLKDGFSDNLNLRGCHIKRQ
jgi:hypothetical protein